MSKTVAAQCQAEIVTVQGFPVEGATILSGGKGSSQGIAVIDEDKAYYLANSTPDLETTLGKLIDVLDQIKEGLTKAADALTKIDTAAYIMEVTGDAVGTPSPPVATSDISGLQSAAAAIDPIKADLETLKGNLI